MPLAVGFLDVLNGHVGVDLCGGKVGVSQHFLDGAQVSPPRQHVGGKAVAQGVVGLAFL